MVEKNDYQIWFDENWTNIRQFNTNRHKRKMYHSLYPIHEPKDFVFGDLHRVNRITNYAEHDERAKRWQEDLGYNTDRKQS